MAKKKESLREKRIREKLERKAEYQEQNKDRMSSTDSAVNDNKTSVKDKSEKKSRVKANGMKSMFAVGDELVLTGFGRGNEAVLETRFSGNSQRRIVNPGSFDAQDEGKTIMISSQRHRESEPGHADKSNVIRQDLIGAKDAIEKRYFGKTFDDNIHIQLAYNILDIEKILSQYIDSIIYCLSNVTDLTDESSEYKDIIGNRDVKSMYSDKDALLQKFVESPRLGYFGNAFYSLGYDTKTRTGNDKNKNMRGRRSNEEIAAILGILGSTRQNLKHSGATIKVHSWLYNLDHGNETDLPDYSRAILDKLYSERVDSLNDDFIKINTNNLSILFNALNLDSDEEKKKCTQDFYRFVVTKEARNIGFTVKKLRELIIDNKYPQLREKQYDGARSQFYRWFDFIIFNYYSEGEGYRDAQVFIEELRHALDSESKEKAYVVNAKKLYSQIEKNLDCICDEIKTGKDIQKVQAADILKQSEAKSWIEDICVKSEGTSYFTKLMYLLSLFLDGKEINILLSSLINKFENIQSFIDVINQLGLDGFKPADKKSTRDYSFFMQSGMIADQLRVVKSFARMETPISSVEWIMYSDALSVLGLDSQEHDKYHDVFFPVRTSKDCSVQKTDMSLRNFIKNNVINSSRFLYLIRFTKVEQIREFAANKDLIKFVLRKMPDKQIERYFESCVSWGNKSNYDHSKMINELSYKLVNFSFNNNRIRDVKQKSNDIDEKTHKESLVAIIGLYLTVLYLIAKNLVSINSRYTLAIHCLERDTILVTGHDISKSNKKPIERFIMVDHYIETQLEYEKVRRAANKRFNKRALNYITDNRNRLLADEETGSYLFQYYRNAVAHLSAVSYAPFYAKEMNEITSYFDVYHYAMQRYLADCSDYNTYIKAHNPDIDSLLDDCKNFGNYQKDLVWLYNVPFAYNLPRYKNLSIADLFSKDEQKPIVSDEEKGK